MTLALLSVAVVIPTWKGERYLPPLLAALRGQTLVPAEILVVDTQSGDAGPQIAAEAGCTVLSIGQHEFNHGGTRNRGARATGADILVFLSQDAVPDHETFLECLVAPFADPQVGGVCSRQVAYSHASPIEAFARQYNYPSASAVRDIDQALAQGVRGFFFSNVASAVRRSAFEAVGAFPDDLVMNEDMVLCARLLGAGWKVAYAAEAVVRHSHDYTFVQQFRRYFDIGAFFGEYAEALPAARGGAEGLAYLHRVLTHLWSTGQVGWIPQALVDAAFRYAGYRLGLRRRWLPDAVVDRCSMHAFHWRQSPARRQAGRSRPRIAVVHDWIETAGGSEQVVAAILRVVPSADLFSLVDFRDAHLRRLFAGRRSTTTFIQSLPWARRVFRMYLPLMPVAIEQVDLSGYDLVISSSHAVAKGVIVPPAARHLCYCHSPLRYAWDQQHAYRHQGAFGGPLRSAATRLLLHYLRSWDVLSSARVDRFIANSRFVAQRIERYWRRSAEVLPPPVRTGSMRLGGERDGSYVVVSRLVPYKRVDVVVEAFRHLPDRRLVVVGDGPEADRLRFMAPDNVDFVGRLSDEALVARLGRSRALIYAGEEDFGMVMVEALACGTPVIAYRAGGALDIVVPGVTGEWFESQDPQELAVTIRRFEDRGGVYEPEVIRRIASTFSVASFESRFADVVDQEIRIMGLTPPVRLGVAS